MTADVLDDAIAVGPCCLCGGVGPMRSIIQLHLLAPEAARGKGWGCAVCGLHADGALAIVCDPCVGELDERGIPRQPIVVRWACAGYVTEPGRVELETLQEPFDHDLAKHHTYEVDPREDLDDWDDVVDWPGDTAACRYVEPTFVGGRGDEELHKCCGCNRFFVQHVPLIAFLGEGENMLQVEVCENCTPKLVGRMRG